MKTRANILARPRKAYIKAYGVSYIVGGLLGLAMGGVLAAQHALNTPDLRTWNSHVRERP